MAYMPVGKVMNESKLVDIQLYRGRKLSVLAIGEKLPSFGYVDEHLWRI